MMFERFTIEARAVVVDAQLQARRLGHDFLGCEHLLLAVASSVTEAGAALREAGATPQALERATVRLVGGPCQPLDREALASVGIDLDAVRAKVEAAFGLGALNPARSSTRRWRRRRRCQAPGGPGHIPFTDRAKKCLELTVREARALHQHEFGPEHLALALVSMTDGTAAPILAATTGQTTAQLRVAILDRYRRAG